MQNSLALAPTKLNQKALFLPVELLEIINPYLRLAVAMMLVSQQSRQSCSVGQTEEPHVKKLGLLMLIG